MGRLVDLDDVVSAGVITARLGWARIQKVHEARRHLAFPDPAKTISRTSLWLWPEVEQWAIFEGWQRWPADRADKRVMVVPGDIVPGTFIAQRLPIDANQAGWIEDLEPVRTDGGLGPSYRWADAEELWHEYALSLIHI